MRCSTTRTRSHKLVTAPGWNDFVDENGSVTDYLDATKFGPFLKEQNESLKC